MRGGARTKIGNRTLNKKEGEGVYKSRGLGVITNQDAQYSYHERIQSIIKIMITKDWSIFHYQDNDHEDCNNLVVVAVLRCQRCDVISDDILVLVVVVGAVYSALRLLAITSRC